MFALLRALWQFVTSGVVLLDFGAHIAGWLFVMTLTLVSGAWIGMKVGAPLPRGLRSAANVIEIVLQLPPPPPQLENELPPMDDDLDFIDSTPVAPSEPPRAEPDRTSPAPQA